MSGKRTKGSVFDAIEDDAGVVEQLKIKSALIDCLTKYIQDNDLTQQEAADRMGVQRSRIGDVCRGHISVFSIDALIAMAARVGLHPVKIAA